MKKHDHSSDNNLHFNTDKMLLNEAERLLSKYFDEAISVTHVEIMSKAERRNKLLRLYISPLSLTHFHQKEIPQTVILKQTLLNPEDKSCSERTLAQRFINDSLGLAFLSTLHIQ